MKRSLTLLGKFRLRITLFINIIKKIYTPYKKSPNYDELLKKERNNFPTFEWKIYNTELSKGCYSWGVPWVTSVVLHIPVPHWINVKSINNLLTIDDNLEVK